MSNLYLVNIFQKDFEEYMRQKTQQIFTRITRRNEKH